ncbi:MAG: universal stress protein [Ahrensia sp.]|nr:universal stress protein [Ahrensia sp.]
MAMLIALVDGSLYSVSVCHYAAWIAQRAKIDVKLYHVLGRRGGGEKQDLSGSIRLGGREDLLEKLSELDAQSAKINHVRGRAILDDGREIIEAAGVSVETRLRQGDLIDTIVEKEKNAELIVVGKRGEAADFAKLHLGSNLERIVRASSKPVFIANREFKPVSKVLLAFDGGASSLKAVEYLAQNALCAGLPVTLVHAGNDTPAIRKSLDYAVALMARGNMVASTLIEEGRPETVFSKLVENDGYDLVVMGAYGHSRIRTMIIGSTTSEMIRTCKVPVFIMR